MRRYNKMEKAEQEEVKEETNKEMLTLERKGWNAEGSENKRVDVCISGNLTVTQNVIFLQIWQLNGKILFLLAQLPDQDFFKQEE